MAATRPNGGDRRRLRRWSFGACIFDESQWTLFVDGQRVAVETKPLELLRELLLNAGNVVSKDELLDRIWPDVTVVEASLPTAVHKLRLAIGDDRRDRCVIETVSGIGYRLTVPVEVDDLSADPSASVAATQSASAERRQEARAFLDATGGGSTRTGHRWLFAISGGLVIALAVAAIKLTPAQRVTVTNAAGYFNQRDAANALRKLDVRTIEVMIDAGWNPNTPFDADGNGALNMLLNNCEWDPGHDQRRMLLLARTLIDGGSRLDHRNRWGDTPYSIAKAERYCGPNHPVTTSIRTICYAGVRPLGDRCLASYECEGSSALRTMIGEPDGISV